MTTELTLFSAFIAGLVGSVHCIGMCGGIVGLLTMSLPDNVRQSYLRLIPYLLTYNIGRISSYIIAGVLMGFLGAQFSQMLPLENPRVVAMWVSGLFMIALGLYIGAWWQALTVLEKGGSYLWRKIEPLGRRFLPVKHPLQALGLGLVWGWLPCGLVYAILVFALTSNSAWNGGLLMLAFGLGTLPMLLTMGATAQWFTQFAQKLIVRRIAGFVVILFGLMIFLPHHH
ncbi:sulfite exporter TauE/SafE family protein [Candidatus Marithioploca araucensis]|uniref:Sulfite exporter TauE/SafE family protein n=1 Tax=Candidatus Marithioploca araucensis TaxID=70273 RepID=A0ABT7VU83_9GAMM|nr:sulfite exporter TauE/SafE family protein [Candidatus Marithioploca araucensis]